MLIRHFHSEDDGQPQGGEPSRASDMLDRYGRDALKLAEKLAEVQSDNYSLREKNRTLRQELKDTAAKAAPDGARVLTADEAKAYDAYLALGTPDALKGAQEAAESDRAALSGLRRETAIRAAAEAHGYKPGLLGKVPSLNGKDVIVKDGAAFVDDQPLPDYLAAHDADFLDALPVAPTAQPYPRQSAGGGAPLNAGQAHIQRTYKQGAK